MAASSFLQKGFLLLACRSEALFFQRQDSREVFGGSGICFFGDPCGLDFLDEGKEMPIEHVEDLSQGLI